MKYSEKGSSLSSGRPNTLTSDASGPGSTPGRGTLELDTVYHPFGVFEMCSKLRVTAVEDYEGNCDALATYPVHRTSQNLQALEVNV